MHLVIRYYCACFWHHSEKSNIAITLVDEENSIIGHASFLDYPNREYVEQNEWVSWFANNCDFKRCTVSSGISFSSHATSKSFLDIQEILRIILGLRGLCFTAEILAFIFMDLGLIVERKQWNCAIFNYLIPWYVRLVESTLSIRKLFFLSFGTSSMAFMALLCALRRELSSCRLRKDSP